MRWWLLILALLVLVSVGLSWVHPARHSIGEELITAIESAKEPLAGVRERIQMLRGAMVLLDDGIQNGSVPGIAAEKLRYGDGVLPGMALSGSQEQYWMESAEARLTWNASSTESLRAAYAENSPARKHIWQVLADMGYSRQTATDAIDKSTAALGAMSDHDLMQAWLRADRATLAQSDELATAVCEAMLLMARPETGSVLTFRCDSQQVYGVPLESSDATAWLKIDLYDARGKLSWTGTLRVEGQAGAMPEPDRIRGWAVRMVQEVVRRDSRVPGGNQLVGQSQ